jgi:hypothetical protein
VQSRLEDYWGVFLGVGNSGFWYKVGVIRTEIAIFVLTSFLGYDKNSIY